MSASSIFAESFKGNSSKGKFSGVSFNNTTVMGGIKNLRKGIGMANLVEDIKIEGYRIENQSAMMGQLKVINESLGKDVKLEGISPFIPMFIEEEKKTKVGFWARIKAFFVKIGQAIKKFFTEIIPGLFGRKKKVEEKLKEAQSVVANMTDDEFNKKSLFDKFTNLEKAQLAFISTGTFENSSIEPMSKYSKFNIVLNKDPGFGILVAQFNTQLKMVDTNSDISIPKLSEENILESLETPLNYGSAGKILLACLKNPVGAKKYIESAQFEKKKKLNVLDLNKTLAEASIESVDKLQFTFKGKESITRVDFQNAILNIQQTTMVTFNNMQKVLENNKSEVTAFDNLVKKINEQMEKELKDAEENKEKGTAEFRKSFNFFISCTSFAVSGFNDFVTSLKMITDVLGRFAGLVSVRSSV